MIKYDNIVSKRAMIFNLNIIGNIIELYMIIHYVINIY